MSVFDNIEKFCTKIVSIHGYKLHMIALITIVFFVLLSSMSMWGFVSALIASNFYNALINTLVFAWNSGFAYYCYLRDKLEIEMP